MINPDKLHARALLIADRERTDAAFSNTVDAITAFLDAVLADDEAMKRLKLALPGYTSEFTPDAMRAALTAAVQEDR
jgi:hypothetical protein